MAVVPIISQSWDTNSYVNPTRMNNIETNIGIVSNATGVKYAEGVSVKDKIDLDNTKTDVAVTSLVSGVTVDINKSCKIGKTLYLIVKGHHTGTIANTEALQVATSIGSVANYTFPIGLGQEWNINSIGYGYIGSNGKVVLTSSLTNGYFHICQALPLA